MGDLGGFELEGLRSHEACNLQCGTGLLLIQGSNVCPYLG